MKHIVRQIDNAVWDCAIGQLDARIESAAPNTGETAGERNAAQIGAGIERVIANRGDVARDQCDTAQMCAEIKCPASNVGDVVGDYNAGKVRTTRKGPISNACDGQTVDRTRNGNRSARARIISYGDGAPNGDVLKLRSCRQGRRKDQAH